MVSKKIKLNEIFYMDGSDLRWKTPSSNRVKRGDIVGFIDDKGYRATTIDSVKTKVHRVVWEMHNGKIPNGMMIDHINHNRIDNRIDNLRVVRCIDNKRNSTMQSNNTTGITGVYWCKTYKKWKAAIGVNGKQVSLGYFDNFNDAVNRRKKAEKLYGFHDNHGK